MHLSRAARIAALSTASALAAAALVATAPAAQAVVLTSATTTVTASSSKGAGCTDSAPSSSATQTIPFDADGVARTANATFSNTITKTGSPTDTTAINSAASSTVQATQAGGQLSQVVLTTTTSLSANAALGSAQTCNASSNGSTQTVWQFDLVAPAYVTVSVEYRGGGYSQTYAGQFGSAPLALAGTVGGGPHAVGTGSILLPAGTNYLAQSTTQDSVGAASPTNTRTSATGSSKTTITFQKPGVALAGATGDGTKYLALAGGRDCAAGTLSGTWSTAAGKGKKANIKKAVFYVNGVQKATVSKPAKGTTVSLPGLDPEKAAAVEVKLTLAKKKPKKHHGAKRVDKPSKGGGTATLEQSYLPCS